jgi:hypothetical protein
LIPVELGRATESMMPNSFAIGDAMGKAIKRVGKGSATVPRLTVPLEDTVQDEMKRKAPKEPHRKAVKKR